MFMMLRSIQVKAICLPLFLLSVAAQLSVANKAPQYHHLPPLREQAAIQDAWRDERVSNIPHILQKYGVDAWLVCLMIHIRRFYGNVY